MGSILFLVSGYKVPPVERVLPNVHIDS